MLNNIGELISNTGDPAAALPYLREALEIRRETGDPYGEVETYVDWSAAEEGYGHDVVFGSGVGGWSAEALHLPLPSASSRIGGRPRLAPPPSVQLPRFRAAR